MIRDSLAAWHNVQGDEIGVYRCVNVTESAITLAAKDGEQRFVDRVRLSMPDRAKVEALRFDLLSQHALETSTLPDPSINPQSRREYRYNLMRVGELRDGQLSLTTFGTHKLEFLLLNGRAFYGAVLTDKKGDAKPVVSRSRQTFATADAKTMVSHSESSSKDIKIREVEYDKYRKGIRMISAIGEDNQTLSKTELAPYIISLPPSWIDTTSGATLFQGSDLLYRSGLEFEVGYPAPQWPHFELLGQSLHRPEHKLEYSEDDDMFLDAPARAAYGLKRQSTKLMAWSKSLQLPYETKRLLSQAEQIAASHTRKTMIDSLPFYRNALDIFALANSKRSSYPDEVNEVLRSIKPEQSFLPASYTAWAVGALDVASGFLQKAKTAQLGNDDPRQFFINELDARIRLAQISESMTDEDVFKSAKEIELLAETLDPGITERIAFPAFVSSSLRLLRQRELGPPNESLVEKAKNHVRDRAFKQLESLNIAKKAMTDEEITSILMSFQRLESQISKDDSLQKLIGWLRLRAQCIHASTKIDELGSSEMWKKIAASATNLDGGLDAISLPSKLLETVEFMSEDPMNNASVDVPDRIRLFAARKYQEAADTSVDQAQAELLTIKGMLKTLSSQVGEISSESEKIMGNSEESKNLQRSVLDLEKTKSLEKDLDQVLLRLTQSMFVQKGVGYLTEMNIILNESPSLIERTTRGKANNTSLLEVENKLRSARNEATIQRAKFRQAISNLWKNQTDGFLQTLTYAAKARQDWELASPKE